MLLTYQHLHQLRNYNNLPLTPVAAVIHLLERDCRVM